MEFREKGSLPQGCPAWLRWVESCDSTNTWAMGHPAQLQHGDVVFTRQQTAGRGQQGRVWYAPSGVITASFVLDKIPRDRLSGLSLAAGLAVVYAIEDLVPSLAEMLQIKWPNDVLIDGRKVAGVLCEAVLAQGRSAICASRANSLDPEMYRVIVGVGLNRQADFTRIEFLQEGRQKEQIQGLSAQRTQPISLHEVAPNPPEDLLLLTQLRQYLLQTASLLTWGGGSEKTTGLERLLPALRDRDFLLGRAITLNLDSEAISGQAAGINELGQLLVHLGDGQTCGFSTGRVEW
ncbi:MAG: biotin--[acetyl-CoA-carboxylase] ligase [Thermosynechococcaceae cyanobacterium MS004]|nr:biotin--[acetyl-CoA-carboxylase] ligase [Thermosynechococcaceae cyanobacterium MS004]